jgi:uncharacterized membrane protein YhaH (DUF805 family)
MEWYLTVLRRYAEFTGRARRKEYWMFALVNTVVWLVLYMVGKASLVLLILLAVYGLAVLVPSLAVTVRRLHDTGRSGWWCLISFVPFVGAIVLIVFLCQDSEAGSNAWGANPKVVGA